MAAFVVRRFALAFAVLAVLSCASFCFFAWLSGMPSILTLYGKWVTGLWGGSTFHSFAQRSTPRNFTQTGVTIIAAFGHTVVLLALSIVLVVVLSIGVAVVAASRRGSLLDLTLRAFSYLAWAVPGFMLALLVQLLVNHIGGARGIGPFPLAGWPGNCPAGIGINSGHLTPCPATGSGVRYVLNVLRYTTLPAATLAVGFVGLHARYIRSALLETLGLPFVTTARAKGLPERTVLLRHALRASLVTFVGALLSDFGAILGGALAIDWVFQLNGLCTVFISEFPVDSGGVDPYSLVPVLLLTALLVTVSTTIADLVIYRLDPRIRADL